MAGLHLENSFLPLSPDVNKAHLWAKVPPEGVNSSELRIWVPLSLSPVQFSHRGFIYFFFSRKCGSAAGRQRPFGRQIASVGSHSPPVPTRTPHTGGGDVRVWRLVHSHQTHWYSDYMLTLAESHMTTNTKKNKKTPTVFPRHFSMLCSDIKFVFTMV